MYLKNNIWLSQMHTHKRIRSNKASIWFLAVQNDKKYDGTNSQNSIVKK